ncbi:MAG: tRNA pseudouridine(38-40) synthase TruA, partial [Myxococcota bacterium]|nr:tRNA pseudouridine(38-40) synthase TruA [Myxococcota bacterium]
MSSEDTETTTDDRNILLWVQYCGAGFAGWQRQAVDRTVQGEMEEAISSMTHHPVTLRATSRTDAGVHARAMPAHFTTQRDIPVQGFVRGLNSALPEDVSVIRAEERPLDWSARNASVAKTYCYRYLVSPTRKPLVGATSWYVGDRPLDTEKMR